MGQGCEGSSQMRPKPKTIHSSRKERVRGKKYRAGISMGAIAREYNCNHVTVGRILRRMGV
jgi:hypothetical protein